MVAWTLTGHLNTARDIAKYDPQTGTTTVVNHLVYDAFGNVTSESEPPTYRKPLLDGEPAVGGIAVRSSVYRRLISVHRSADARCPGQRVATASLSAVRRLIVSQPSSN